MTSFANIFKAERFGAYLRKYIRENRYQLLIYTVIILLIPILYCIVYPYVSDKYGYSPINQYFSNVDRMWSSQLVFFNFGWVGLACMAGTGFYQGLKTKTTRISLFTCPASSLEKFLTSFLIYIIGFSAIYLCGIFLADAIRVWIYSGHHVEGTMVEYMSPMYYFSMGESLNFANPEISQALKDNLEINLFGKISALVCAIMILQAFFALGSSVWPKNSGLKTLCFFILYGLILLWLGFKGTTLIPSGTRHADIDFSIDPKTLIITLNCINVAIALFLWWIGYRRFKEWEIIKRW